MKPVSYKRHRFPPDVIHHAVWLYFRITLSLRDVEELLAQRAIEVSYDTIRFWTREFGCCQVNLVTGDFVPPTAFHRRRKRCKSVGSSLKATRSAANQGGLLLT